MKNEDLDNLELLWNTADPGEWQQDKIQPNVVVYKGATTDANAICTAHGEKGEEIARFIVAARNALPALLTELRRVVLSERPDLAALIAFKWTSDGPLQIHDDPDCEYPGCKRRQYAQGLCHNHLMEKIGYKRGW